MQRLEAAFGITFTCDSPCGDGLGKPFEAPRAEVSELEQPAYEPARRLADDDTARLGERLQARHQVRRRPDRRVFLCAALADQTADHHLSGRDADAGL